MNSDIFVEIQLALEDWQLFNAIEVQAVMALDGIAETIEECEIGDNPEADYFWSIYMHFDRHKSGDDFGGVVCVADCRTKESAYALAEEYESKLADIIGDRIILMRDN